MFHGQPVPGDLLLLLALALARPAVPRPRSGAATKMIPLVANLHHSHTDCSLYYPIARVRAAQP